MVGLGATYHFGSCSFGNFVLLDCRTEPDDQAHPRQAFV